MNNIPEVKLGIIAVSRDCFPIALSERRRAAIVKTCGGNIYECPVTVENESDMLAAVENVKAAGASIVETSDLDSYVKVVPAALLPSVADEAAATAFQDYLGSAAAQETWKKYGYELA